VLYFISYTQKDVRWATWIAETIEKHGHEVVIQAWDIRPGDNLILMMDKFMRECDVCIPVLSQEYLDSAYCEVEWAGTLAWAIKEKDKRVVPVRVSDVKPDGVLYAHVYIDLFSIEDEAAATAELHKGLQIIEVIRTSNGFPGRAAMLTTSTKVRYPGAMPPNNLPERNAYFSGREGLLNSIRENFPRDGTIYLKQTITGLGGVGKTQTALEYAHRFGKEYNDAIWWIRAQTAMEAFQDCLSFAEEFGLVPEGIDEARKLTPEELSKRLKPWFTAYSSWLIIFDNVDSAEYSYAKSNKDDYSNTQYRIGGNNHVGSSVVIDPYMSVMQSGHVLITTRHRELCQGKPLDIGLYTPKEAAAFMRTRFEARPHLIDSKATLVALTKRLDYFPLALEQAAAYIIRAQISCHDYLSMLDDGGLEPLLSTLGTPTNYDRAITATLALSLDRLGEGALQMLNLCSYMAPDKIPLGFYKRHREKFPKPLCDGLASRGKVNETVAELLNFSLVKRDGDYLNMHRLVQEVVRELQKGGETDWLELCLDAMMDALPDMDDYGRREVYDWFEQIASHAAVIGAFAEGNEEKKERAAMLYHCLGIGSSYCLAQYSQALEWHQRSLEIREKVLGFEHPSTASTYNDIALCCKDQGNYYKALEWHQKALDVREKVLGMEHPDTATTYNNIAVVYTWLGDHDRALELYQKAITIREKVLGMEHPDTASTYNYVAIVYNNQHDYDRALEWYQRALVIREKVLGMEHPDTASTYNYIALIYTNIGKHDRALELYQKALAIRERVLGMEHPNTASTYNYIARFYAKQGEYDVALKWYKKALTIREKVLGIEHPATAITYNNIADVYQKQEDYDTALTWILKCYYVRWNRFGLAHPYTKAIREHLEATFYKVGLEESFELWLERTLGE